MFVNYYIVDAIIIETSIASTFQLRQYGDVIVNKVDRQSVLLDSVEVIFKDQYIGRSEMWRLKLHLVLYFAVEYLQSVSKPH